MVIETQIPATLVAIFDCTQEYDKEHYFGHADVHVVLKNGLKYREAGGVPSSRFGYRFQVTKVGHPHVAVVTYPHDKRRFMCVMDSTCYDLNSGLVTGQVHPVSGKMEDLDLVFWPRWADCSITVLTYSTGEPAAAATIKIYELESLPPLFPSPQSINLPRQDQRWLGIQYEDPCGCTASEGAHDHFEWTERIIQYAKFTGQNVLIYPLAWYHGPLYPSDKEITDIGEIYVANDRKQYVHWSTHPEDWYKPLLARFNQEGIDFIGSLTLLRLSGLMKKMNVDPNAIARGADTINNMLENNRVKGGTGDWTGIHNAINYEQILAAIPQGEVVPGFRMPKGSKIAYGESNYWQNRAGPIFNPLHPQVQAAIFDLVEEIGTRYKDYPAFKGISINIYASTICWFGNLRIGYDDYTTACFTKDTGILIPVNPNSKGRFGKRAKFLIRNHKNAWIQWRCSKIKALFCAIRDILRRIRPDYRLIVMLWDETVFTPMFGTVGAPHQYGTRMNNYDFYREGGIDLALYQNEPGIVLDISVGCTRDRGGHSPNATAGINIKPEHSSMYRDFDFLDTEKNSQFAALASPGTYHFNCWIESWGKYVWFHPSPNDPNLARVKLMDGKPVDNFIACNSLYPADGFWWDSQERIVPTFLAGDHFLEPFAHALAEFDVQRFTSGGLFLDSAHAPLHRQWAKAFVQLPNLKFHTVGESTDPVAVRALVYNGQRYIYAVNREYYEIPLKIASRGEQSANVRNLLNGEKTQIIAGGHLECTLGPYGLQAWAGDLGFDPSGFQVTLAPEITQPLETRAREVRQVLGSLKNAEKKIPGTKAMITLLDQCLQSRAYAKLRRALTSYIVRKAEELSSQ